MLQLNLHQKIFVITVVLLVTFAAGRYSVSSPAVTTQEQVKTNLQTQQNTATKQHKVIVTVKEPSGATKTTTTIDTDTDVQAVKAETQAIVAEQVITPQKTSVTNLYLIGAYNITSSLNPPLLGVGVSTKLIGPINIGLQGLFGTQTLVGVTAGVAF